MHSNEVIRTAYLYIGSTQLYFVYTWIFQMILCFGFFFEQRTHLFFIGTGVYVYMSEIQSV